MPFHRAAIVAAIALIGMSAPLASTAQPRPQGFNQGGYGQRGGRIPLFQVAQWNESEDGGWSGVWTFEMGAQRRSMSAVWTNQQTGRHRRASGMSVRRSGQQVIISRPGLGNYVGTISGDGRSLDGTLSWAPGRFHAQIAR
jgi:hypothetical protein